MSAVAWHIGATPVPYGEAVAAMERRVAMIRLGQAPEMVWLLEHPPLFTAGSSATDAELVDARGLPVYPTGRGGRYTYHGPGQRVAYVMLDLKRRNSDVRAYVRNLEEWLIRTLARYSLGAGRRAGRVGIWVAREGSTKEAPREDKIAAIGVRVRRWVTYHGVSLNVDPDLAHYAGIIPCGIAEHGVTSLMDLGIITSMEEVDTALRSAFEEVFETETVPA